ncbi:unnamed protein product [Cercospora beticola]|nr:unnamed protein product [Cercospora beticola]
MMPSRGLHALRGKLPRIHQSQCRNLSSTSIRPTSLRIASSTSSPLSRTTIPISRTSRIAIPSIAAFRYASTQPSPPAGTPPPVHETTSSLSNIDTITLDDVSATAAVDPNSIPEQIGYLHSIGVDYGYGPTSMIQWTLEHAHVWLGLPWWASILFTAATLRVALAPFFLKMSDMQARSTALAPVLKPFNEKVMEEQRRGNTAGALQAYQQMGAIKKRAGISNVRMFTPILLQGVLGFCGYRLMHYLATFPVPGFKDGGLLWLQDLTITDGYLLLPLIMAATMHTIIRLGGEAGTATMPPGFKKFMMWGMPTIIFAVTAFQPGAVALWFCGSGVIGIPQSLLLQRPAVREYFGLAPLYKPKPGEAGPNILESMMKQFEPAKSAPTSPHSGGKNAAYMRPQYQSPNVRTTGSTTTIDTKLVDKIDMVQPNSPPKGVFARAKEGFKQGQVLADKFKQKQATAKDAKQKADAQRAEFKRRAEEYEKKSR